MGPAINTEALNRLFYSIVIVWRLGIDWAVTIIFAANNIDYVTYTIVSNE